MNSYIFANTVVLEISVKFERRVAWPTVTHTTTEFYHGIPDAFLLDENIKFLLH